MRLLSMILYPWIISELKKPREIHTIFDHFAQNDCENQIRLLSFPTVSLITLRLEKYVRPGLFISSTVSSLIQ